MPLLPILSRGGYMVLALAIGFYALRGLRSHAPLRVGAFYYASFSAVLVDSLAMLLLAASGLPFRHPSFKQMLRASVWAAVVGLQLCIMATLEAHMREVQGSFLP